MTATQKLALVLATFGSAREQEKDFVHGIKEEFERRHPGAEVFIAYTSRVVTAKRRKKGEAANALAQILAQLSVEGFSRVAVQSLHVAPGMEYEMLCDITRRFANMPKGIVQTVTGPPLICNDRRAEQVAALLASDLPVGRKAGEAVLFVGHGAKLPAGTLTYPALQAYLWQHDPALYVGTLEGSLSLEKLLGLLRRRGHDRVWLTPLLAYYGVHVADDMFGRKGESWLTGLESAGFDCIPVETTLLARPAVVELWIESAVEAMETLGFASPES